MSTITHMEYLSLAIPFTISTLTQPLLGAVDTAVVGRLGSPAYIGGVAIGTVIFNTLYWLFGFLRVSTSGLSAQSLGSANSDDRYNSFFRPQVIAMIMGLLFVILQLPILKTAVHLYKADADVTRHAVTYFTILIWGAPFVLIHYVNLGWLMGRKRVRESLFLQISANVLNILLDLLFVLVFRWEVAGVAWATLISQTYAFVLGMVLISRRIELKSFFRFRSQVLEFGAMKRMMAVNANLLIRTVCLLTMTNMFTARGSSFGADILAANAILFQIQYIVAYFFDGLSNASSVFAGKSVGEGDPAAFNRIVAVSHLHAAWLCVCSALFLALLQAPIIRCFTDLAPIIALCSDYMVWLVAFPIVMGIGLVYSGFYTGATYTAPVRKSLLVALLVFVIAYHTAIPLWGNHGLWLAFILFSFFRSGVLLLYKKELIEKVFPTPQPATAPESVAL